jgi:hypothetical protein
LVLLRLTDAFHSIVLHLPVGDGDDDVLAGTVDSLLRACGVCPA